MLRNPCSAALVLALLNLVAGAEEIPGQSGVASLHQHLLPFLEAHCFDCHDDAEQKGDLNLRKLSTHPIDEISALPWVAVLERVEAGEMPPKTREPPAEAELREAMSWLGGALDSAEAAVKSQGVSTGMRRLNRVEYRNTMRDLIGHPYDPAELLPPDTISHGFDNVGESLVVSPLHVESFVAANERILDKVLNIPEGRPFRQHWRILNSTPEGKPLLKDDGSWHDGHRGKNREKIKPGFLKGNVLPNAEVPSGFTPYTMVDLTEDPPKSYEGAWDIRVFGGSQIDEGLLIREGDNAFGFKWFAYEEGVYRVRVHLSSFGPEDWEGLSPKVGIVRYPEGTLWRERLLEPNRSEVLEIELYRDSVDWYLQTNGNRHWGLKLYYQLGEEASKAGTKVPFGLHISQIEIEGPLHPEWPPVWHRRVFPDRVAGEGDEAYAGRVLRRFMSRAYRRAVSEGESARMLKIYRQEREAGLDFKEALRMPLSTILSSPAFLYLGRDGPGGTGNRAWELASRLSYFLWRSMPDERLFELAASGDLLREDVVLLEIDRMLQDAKSKALVEHFTRQWLGLDRLDALEVDRALHPDFDHALQDSMIGESLAFFTEILRENLSLDNFLDSDFAMLNERIAWHYGIAGVDGSEFRKVALDPRAQRGGVLTQAAVLTATANGLRTMPIKRGAFVLGEILADPPKPPPADVPTVEEVTPDRALATLRERLEQHRSSASCKDCHRKIDPLGFALENYDAIGRWRTHELVEVAADRHRPQVYLPGELITLRFANGTGEPNDWIAVLPAREDNNRKFEEVNIWKHTTDTRKRLPNGLFHGTVTLPAPEAPGEYEARLFFAGGYEVEARQRFLVASVDGEVRSSDRRAPLLLDPENDSHALSWVPVDSTGKLPDGRMFEDMTGFKKLLLEDREDFFHCLTEKMLVYALGRPVGFGDRSEIKDIVEELTNTPTLKHLIKCIVLRDIFHPRGEE